MEALKVTSLMHLVQCTPQRRYRAGDGKKVNSRAKCAVACTNATQEIGILVILSLKGVQTTFHLRHVVALECGCSKATPAREATTTRGRVR